MNTLILKLDIAGNPIRWIDWQTAASLYVRGDVAWDLGEETINLHGGYSRFTGERSVLEMRTIISVRGKVAESKFRGHATPPLTNRELFLRDDHVCLYCGERFSGVDLTRDHVIPRVQGGPDRWSNVVAACRSCNLNKGGRRPEQAGMPLLAVPYVPNRAEWLILANRRICTDQMDFLKVRVGKNSRLHGRA